MKQDELVEQVNNLVELTTRLSIIIQTHLPATSEPIDRLFNEYNRIVKDIHEEYK